MIENFKELLYAIFNSDPYSEKGYECPIIVYDTLNYDLPVAVFKNARTCAEFFDTNKKIINHDICLNVLKKNRYRLERVKVEDEK